MLSRRYSDALQYAAEAHRDQVRKGSGIPYVSHLLAVSAIALENGADEDEAIAALFPRADKLLGADASEQRLGQAQGRLAGRNADPSQE